jgi:beta-1,4-N-acetylglucosaminyltransferase
MGDNRAADASGSPRKTKICFITVGATAPFDGLIKAVLEPKFLQALHDANYTDLQVQHGYEAQDNLFSRLSQHPNISEFCKSSHLKLTGFGFDKDGLDKYMRGAKGIAPRGSEIDNISEGVVMSHAGQQAVRALASHVKY